MGTSVSRRNRTKVLVEPVLEYLSDTQALTYMPPTSEHYFRSAHSQRDHIQGDSPVEAINVASDLREHPKVELRGLEPLASCMPSMTSPSGMVRDGRVYPGQSRVPVRYGPEPTGMDWARSHWISHWPQGGREAGRSGDEAPPASHSYRQRTHRIPPVCSWRS